MTFLLIKKVIIFFRSDDSTMGNAGSNQSVGHHHGSNTSRDSYHHRHSKEHPSPSLDKEGHFIFDKKTNQKLVFQSSNEEEEPFFTKVWMFFLYFVSNCTL